MKRSGTIRLGFVVVVFLLLSWCTEPLWADTKSTSMDPTQLDVIGDAVMEVVVLKPTTDSMQYEKPLSLDYLTYTFRTDKYYSIGTAFAISP